LVVVVVLYFFWQPAEIVLPSAPVTNISFTAKQALQQTNMHGVHKALAVSTKCWARARLWLPATNGVVNDPCQPKIQV
jgi:hypothetical protein